MKEWGGICQIKLDLIDLYTLQICWTNKIKLNLFHRAQNTSHKLSKKIKQREREREKM